MRKINLIDNSYAYSIGSINITMISIMFILMKSCTLKCQINGGGPNNQGGWKNFQNLINRRVRVLEMS